MEDQNLRGKKKKVGSDLPFLLLFPSGLSKEFLPLDLEAAALETFCFAAACTLFDFYEFSLASTASSNKIVDRTGTAMQNRTFFPAAAKKNWKEIAQGQASC